MILVNGNETGVVAAADRGLAYGDGVFRTLLVRNGAPQQWPRQRAKLGFDCAALGIAMPEKGSLEQDVTRVCRANRDCALKVIVTRGIGERGYRYAENRVPTRIVLSAPLPSYPPSYAEAGVKVRLCRLQLAHQPALAGIKHLNRLENVLARAEWTDPSIAEGIICDAHAHAIGGTMTNLFIAKNGALVTPGLERCGIAGVTRDRVIDAAARHDAACEVTILSWDDVLAADEIFLVNSLLGVWPVRDIEGETRAPGPLTRAVQSWLNQEDDAKAA